jgi:nucleolysin TIA-1/TIAR
MAGESNPDDGPRNLYVGNLDPRVTDYILGEVFASVGPVRNVKIIPDKHYQHGGLNYGFVEMADHRSADQALQALNGRKIYGYEIRVNWAFTGNAQREDTTNHYHVFVGDLSPEVNDAALVKAFKAFGSLSDARVMWDSASGKSRGYGFVAFREKADAEQAINTMNDQFVSTGPTNETTRVVIEEVPKHRRTMSWSHRHPNTTARCMLAT